MPECPRLATWVIAQDAAEATGNGTAIVVSDMVQGGYQTLALQVEGITTATVTWEATVDGTNWIAVQFTNLNDGTAATTATADGLYRMTVTGLASVRARISAYTSGTITVNGFLVG